MQPAQTRAGYRMIEEPGHDARRVFEVVDRLEKRNNRQRTNQSVGFPFGQSGFLGEKINGEQIGNMPRHADDGCANSFCAVTPHMIGQRAVSPEHGRGFGSRVNAAVEEVVRTGKTFVEEGQSLLLAPRGEIGLGRTGGNEDLFYGAIVERAVLPYVQRGEVEAENFHDPQKRIDVRLDQTTRADIEQAVAQQTQIALQFGGMTVGARTVVQYQAARGCAFHDG